MAVDVVSDPATLGIRMTKGVSEDFFSGITSGDREVQTCTG